MRLDIAKAALRSGLGESSIHPGAASRAASPAGAPATALIMVAFQNEYVDGALALPGAQAALASARRLLTAARIARYPVLHIAHYGEAGDAFDRGSHGGAFVRGFTPLAVETVIETPFPCPLPADHLPEALAATGTASVIVAGFMTDICVTTTAQTARRLGYRVTIEASACATRGLPTLFDCGVDAATLQAAALAELASQNIAITHGYGSTA